MASLIANYKGYKPFLIVNPSIEKEEAKLVKYISYKL
jgi:hypothetical protein